MGALVASILAVGAAPATGQQPIGRDATSNHNPDWGANWSACVGAARTHDQGFPDVGEDHAHAGAINCIAYYGVTEGKGDGSYAPDENVSAFQMRLFVQRAAELMDADGDAVLAAVEPLSDPVTRLDMAKLMFGLVNDISGALRYNPRTNDIEFDVNGNGVWDKTEVVDDYFGDARAQVPNAESQLVGATYELGITRGTRMDGTRISTPDSTFEPFKAVTRAQMAAFITRTLDHSNLRPAGLAVQRNTAPETQISLRDSDFMPIVNEPIDVFSALYPDDAFDNRGECVLRFVKDETPSFDACQIDIGDQLTDSDGNVDFELSSDKDPITVQCGTTGSYTFASAGPGGATVFWAWTGSLGDEVDDDTTLQALEDVARPVGRAGPDYLRISGGLPTGDELARMGETVTFTAQLYSAGTGTRDGATLVDDVAVGPDRTGNVYLLQIERYHLTRVDGTDSDYGDTADGRTRSGNAVSGTGTLHYFADAPGDWNYGAVSREGIGGSPIGTGENAIQPAAVATQATLAQARIGAAYFTPVFPNADGQFTIDLQNMDVFAGRPDTDVGVRFVLRRFAPSNDLLDANPLENIVENAGTNTVDVTAAVSSLPYAGDDVAVGAVIFSDDPSDTHSVAGESAQYQIISGSRTANVVTVKVVDQYGDPQRNVAVTVNSNLDDIDPTTDQVLYPEQVDITVQARENGDRSPDTEEGNSTAGVKDLVLPTTVVTSLTAAAFYDATLRSQAVAARKAEIADGSNDDGIATKNVPVALRVTDTGAVAQVPTDDVIGTFKTRRDGTYRIGYAYTAPTVAQTEKITPSSAQATKLTVTATATGGSGDTEPTVTAAVALGEVTIAAEVGSPEEVYWAKTGTAGMSDDELGAGLDVGFVPLRVADVARRTIVANEAVTGQDVTESDEPAAYFYDEDDVFIIDNIGASFEMFEEALGLTVRNDGCKADMVQWENYTFYRDPGRYGARPGRVDRTIWELTIN